jgi:protein TonB
VQPDGSLKTAMSAAASHPAGSLSIPGRLQLRRIGPLGAIILLHIGLFHALRSSAPQETMHHLPAKEVVATFVTPEPAPAPPKPQAAAPAAAPAPKKAAALPKPAKHVPDTAPSPQAITEPPAAPAPAEPVAPPVAAAPAAPPAPPAPPQPKTITSGIEYIQPPQPDYPPISRRMGEEGKAILRVLVNDKGRPERIEVQKSSGSARLDEAARQAVLRAVFKPFIENGKPVAAYAIVPIRFQLDS